MHTEVETNTNDKCDSNLQSGYLQGGVRRKAKCECWGDERMRYRDVFNCGSV